MRRGSSVNRECAAQCGVLFALACGGVRLLRTGCFAITLCAATAVYAQQSPVTPAPTPGVGTPGSQPQQPSTVTPQQPITSSAIGVAPQPGAAASPSPADSGVTSVIGEPGRAPGDEPGGVRSIGPAARGESGVTVISGSEMANEPFLRRTVHFGPSPDGGEVITLSGEGQAMTAMEFLDILVAATNWNLLATKGVEDVSMRFWIMDMTPQNALNVLKFNGVHYEYDEETNFLYVQTVEEYLRGKFGAIQQHDFVIRHADIIDLEAILANFVSPNGRIISEPRTGRLMIWDTEDNIADMTKIIERLDVPVEPRIFKLNYLNVADMEDGIGEFLSERGTAISDPRSNTLTITDLPNRLEKIASFIETVDRKLERRVWTLNYIEPDEIASRIEFLVPEEMGEIVVDDMVRQITVSALPERLEEIDTLVKVWDVKKRQVEIEAYLISSANNIIREFGVNWFYIDEKSGETISLTSGDQLLDFERLSSGQLFQIGTIPYQVPLRVGGIGRDNRNIVRDINNVAVPNPEYRSGGVSAVLDYLDSQGKVQILSRPRVVVIDGEEAVFENTEDRPFQEGGISTFVGQGQQGGFNQNFIPLRVQFITVGTILKVAPTIAADNNIIMEISAEDSSADTVNVTVGGQTSTVPQKRQSKTQTQVIVHNMQTIVIGGLRTSSLGDDMTKVPLLGDLPLLGRLFKNTKKDHRERELLVFITPTIVDEFTQPEAAHLARADEYNLNTMRDSMKTAFGRWMNRLSRGENEIVVSVGQTGSYFSEGQAVTLEDLAMAFGEMRSPRSVTLVIRAHSRAPESAITAVIAEAELAGLRIERDDFRSPFVPISRDEAPLAGEQDFIEVTVP